MRIEPEIGSVSIVLLGSFNPSIFQPYWFAFHGLITESEAKDVQGGLVHPELTSIRIGNFTISVEPGKFSIETTVAPWISIADLVARIFEDQLYHTPIEQFGINRQVHFGVGSEAVRNVIGQTLAPAKGWGEWAERLERRPTAARSGVISVTMQETKLSDPWGGYTRATVQPSAIISGNSGIFMQVNDHWQRSTPLNSSTNADAIEQLRENFEPSIRHAEWIIDQIMALRDKLR